MKYHSKFSLKILSPLPVRFLGFIRFLPREKRESNLFPVRNVVISALRLGSCSSYAKQSIRGVTQVEVRLVCEFEGRPNVQSGFATPKGERKRKGGMRRRESVGVEAANPRVHERARGKS